MMRIARVVVAVVLVFACSGTFLPIPAAAEPPEPRPPLPYLDWGVCPFECCTYQQWTAAADIPLYEKRSHKSHVAAQVKSGEKVRGISGVVVTTEAGKTKVLKPVKLGYSQDSQAPELSLKPGDMIYTIHKVELASMLFWYHGKFYTDEVGLPEKAKGNIPFKDELEIVSRPKTEWWAVVESADGRIGWTDQTDSFKHVDRCE